jgi:phosphatidylserine/phosphatidylglycerophosphate/cardiolipin synthase-like enzyme
VVRLRAQTIVIPCVSFAVRVRLSEDTGGLTPIERIVLMAIGARLDTVDRLAETLNLPRRLLLDLIYDFWHKDYVLIDDERACVQLTPEVQALHDADRLSSLESAENNVEMVSLIQELVSGAVLPNVARVAPPHGAESMLVPTLMGGLELAEVSRAALLTALGEATERQSRQSKRSQVVREAWIEPEQILRDEAGTSRRAHLTLIVDIFQPPGSTALEFDIIDAPGVSPVVRRSIARGLTRLARELPDQLFFKRLRQQLARSSDEGGAAVDPIASLERAVAGLGAVDPGVLRERHAAFVHLHTVARLHLAERAAAEADVRVVLGHDEQEAALEEMLAAARHQVVLGNPWIDLKTMLAPRAGGSWFERIEQALARGVQMVLLWGIAVDEELRQDVRSALHDLRDRYHPRFIWSIRPSVSHAKFAIQDAHAALVTSYNFFDPRGRAARELGVRVAGVRPGEGTTAVLAMLQWARDAFPDHRQSLRILVLPEDMDAAAHVPATAEPPELPALAADEVRPSAIRHWADAWKHAATELVALRRSFVRGAELVVDRMHRDALAHALEHCERRLAVLSDGLSVDVVTDELVDHLRQRLRAGAACSLLYRRTGASDLAAGPAARLTPLAAEFPRTFVMTEGKSHAKVLLCDDEVLIGSFNFLSYGGDYDRRLQAERAELSIRVRDTTVVQKIAEALASHWPDAFAALAGRVAREEPPGPGLAVIPQLQPLFTALRAEPDPGALLLRWFAERPRPWADLEALRDAGVGEALLVRAVAAALASNPAAEPERRRWLWWLAEQRWRASDFLGCALLVPSDGASPLGLDASLVRTAAAVEAPTLVATPEVDTQASPDGLAARVLLAIVDVLVHGRPPADPRLLAEPPRSCARHLRRWAQAAATYHATASEPLPWALLRRRADAESQRQARNAARERFTRALATAEQVGFRFPLGQHTWDALRAEGQPLGAMRAALAADDPDALDRYFVGLDRAGRTIEATMDALSEGLRDAHDNHRIEHPKRRVCLARLDQAETAAREWVASARSATPSPAESHLLSACYRMRAALADLADPDATPLAELAEPVRRFALTRMQVLFAAEES